MKEKIDSTQIVLIKYLKETEILFKQLLQKKGWGEHVQIISALDLGFPHDVIRIAGGFATGAYVGWDSAYPIIPIDTCVNDCSVSFFEITEAGLTSLCESNIEKLESRIQNSIYKLNFHRGNHFMAVIQSKKSKKFYLLLHSSANEFKDNYNGLYPVEGNYFYSRTKVFRKNNHYLRYLEGTDAEIFWCISRQLPSFNEARQEFLASILLDGFSPILNMSIYHHYYMPDENSVIMGGHIAQIGEEYPFLTSAGNNIYMIRYNDVKDKTLKLSGRESFITPHGLGKGSTCEPDMKISMDQQTFSLDGITYPIRFGSSLRDHPNLSIRDFNWDKYRRYLNEQYDIEIIDEFVQLTSWNKRGIIQWNTPFI